MSESITNNSLEINPSSSSSYPKRRKFLREATKSPSKPLSEQTDTSDTNGEMEDTSIHLVEHIINKKVVNQISNLLGSEEDDNEECEANFNEDDGGQKSNASKMKCVEHKDECRDGNWGERDRQRLLVALRRFGMLNIPELMKAVPGKTESEIKEYIQFRWKTARAYLRSKLKKGMEGSIGPVDDWLNCLKDHFNQDFYKCTPLARAILFIWKFEDHPDPKECGGIDFKALYEHLYYLLCGFPPRELNRPTAMYLNCSLKLFSRRVKVDSWTDEKQLVSLLNVQKGVKKTKTDEDVIAALSYDSTQSLEELLKRPGFNPFAIPLDVLLHMDKSLSSDDAENAETSD